MLLILKGAMNRYQLTLFNLHIWVVLECSLQSDYIAISSFLLTHISWCIGATKLFTDCLSDIYGCYELFEQQERACVQSE